MKILCFASTVLLMAWPARAEIRTWKDASGAHQVRAELVGVAGSNVTLKTEDGRTIQMAFANLSKEDQAHLKGGSAGAGEWPGFRGPRRDDVSQETGLLKDWPAGGPKRLWVMEGAGLGYAGFAVSGGKLFTMGLIGNDEKLIAIDVATGKKLWETKIDERYSSPPWGEGPRGTPTVAGDLVFALGANGGLLCASTKDGKKIWEKSLTKDFGGKVPKWGYTESPLVDGAVVVVTPGGPKGAIAALNAKTGKTEWQTKDFTDLAEHASPIVVDFKGERQYVQLMMTSFAGVSAKDGKVIWRSDFPNGRTAVIPTPIYSDGMVYVTAGYGAGCKAVKLGSSNPEVAYENKTMVNHHGGVVLVGDYLYGHSDAGGWTCQEFKTGREVWKNTTLRKGCLTYADGRLYCLGEDKGEVVLIEASPDGWKEHGRFELEAKTSQRAPQGKIWTHPVVCNGRLYLRDQEFISCYDVKG